MKKYIPLILVLLAIAPMVFIHSCANTTQAPSGGRKDSIPPSIVMIDPLPGTLDFPLTGGRIVFTFNEYVTIKEPRNIFLSPPAPKVPTGRIRGKSLVVSLQDTLKPNTTYTLSINAAVADNNEGNLYPGFSYVFSTGDSIDSLAITGKVQDCSTLAPVKNATVMLYKDHSDSAIFKGRPDAAARTDDWGFFIIPFIPDTSYRLYAIYDENNNNLYDPETELVAFHDTPVRPVMVVTDTLREFMKYDMTDTLGCKARREEYELNLFRDNPARQYIVNKVRVSDRASYITFRARNAWIDSLWIAGYPSDRLITQFNILQDSLEIWVNDTRRAPDTLNLYVNYRKTDSLGRLMPELEHIKLYEENKEKLSSYERAKRLEHKDTICNFKLEFQPETVEQEGLGLEFVYPIVYENFDKIRIWSINPRQQEEDMKFTVERDSLNIRRYIIRPQGRLMAGYDYNVKIPQNCFRDINGFYSDSTVTKFALPSQPGLSTITAELRGVGQTYIVDLMNAQHSQVLRRYTVHGDGSLSFPYLKAGNYSIRIAEDRNGNTLVDSGSLLEHRQPEKVLFVEREGSDQIPVIENSEIVQRIDLSEMFKR